MDKKSMIAVARETAKKNGGKVKIIGGHGQNRHVILTTSDGSIRDIWFPVEPSEKGGFGGFAVKDVGLSEKTHLVESLKELFGDMFFNGKKLLGLFRHGCGSSYECHDCKIRVREDGKVKVMLAPKCLCCNAQLV